MPQTRRLGHIVLKVRDAQKSKDLHTVWQVGSFAELQAAHRELGALGIEVESTVEHDVSRSIVSCGKDDQR
ncbi:MAG TPA: hypothetical protein VMQ51_17800 [Candidatus Binatia bacterium]|nr:hypothetical protein [Candidatus Binatia bacterium]